MFKRGIHLCSCLLLVVLLQQPYVLPAKAGEKEERVQLLQEKMEKLKELLAEMQDEKLRAQPPTEVPWQPILQLGEERPAYAQYAYLLAPQMRKVNLDSTLQQLHFIAGQDELKERGTLFVIPSLPLAAGEQMSVERYNRDLAGQLLRKVGLPAALEGGLIVVPDSLDRPNALAESLLFIDLAGFDQILRARVFQLLASNRLFTDDGSIHAYLWELLLKSSPQAFSIHMRDKLVWVAVDND